MDARIVRSLLSWTLEHAPNELEHLPLLMLIREMARQNDRRPAKIELHAPDDWVLNIGGDEKLRDVYLLTRVPREQYDRWVERLEAERSAKCEEPVAPTEP